MSWIKNWLPYLRSEILLNRGRLSKITFVLLNVIVSILGFLRSFIFLKQLDFYELGLVSMFQTMILLMSLSQIGILNGSYRAFSGSKKFYRSAINNFVFSFFLMLFGVTLLVVVAYQFVNFSSQVLILLLGAIVGVFTLMATYLNNSLLADQKIRQVNIISFISNILSYASLWLVIYNPLFALLSFVIQPVIFIALTFLADRSLIPRKVLLSRSIFQFLLRLGFIPYLTALFVYLNLQIERWTIVYALGIESFGRFYLTVTYATLFALFPAAVNNLYFAQMVRALSEGKTIEFGKLLRRYSYILICYCLVAAAVTALFAKPLIAQLFPQHAEYLVYVFYTIPGLVAITAVNPFLVYFNASLNLKPLLTSYGIGTIAVLVITASLYFSNNVSLANMAVVDTLGNASIAISILCYFLLSRRRRATAVHAAI